MIHLKDISNVYIFIRVGVGITNEVLSYERNIYIKLIDSL